MPIPVSGPISLTTIQTEFGGANPIGLNEYYAGGGLVAPGTAGTFGPVPSSGAISLQNFYGTTSVTYWVATIDTNYSGAWSHATFASANGVWSAICNGGFPGAPRSFLTNIGDISGVGVNPGNDQSIGPSSPAQGPSGNAFDANTAQPTQYWTNISDGSYYATGNANITSSLGGGVVKVNSAGGLIWYRRITTSNTIENTLPSQIWRDSSGFNWICGRTRLSEVNGFVIRLDDSGTIVTQKNIDPGPNYTGVVSTVTDSSNAPAFVMIRPFLSSRVAKMDSTLSTFAWRKQFAHVGFGAVTISNLYPSGSNTIVSGWLSVGNSVTRQGLIMSLNSSGNIAWGYRLVSTNAGEGGAIYVDADANIWWVWYTFNSDISTQVMGISKFNSSGALLFQRGITNVANPIKAGSVAVVGIALYVTATYNVPNFAPVVLKLPADGSKTGTYGGFTYADYGYTHSSDLSDIVVTDATDISISNYTATVETSPNTNSIYTPTRTSFTPVP
jgi:hypothetical protein